MANFLVLPLLCSEYSSGNILFLLVLVVAVRRFVSATLPLLDRIDYSPCPLSRSMYSTLRLLFLLLRPDRLSSSDSVRLVASI